MPTTLFALAGIVPPVARLAEATLLLIDYQNEYLEGPLALPHAAAALDRARALLAAARAAGTAVVHVAHHGAPGGPFDRDAARGGFIAGLEPRPGEAVVEKRRADAFVGTDLAERLGAPGPLLIAGFMTHNCVSSTVRAACDLGYAVTVAGDACATRDLPAPGGGVVTAADLHRATLAALADRHCAVVASTDLN